MAFPLVALAGGFLTKYFSASVAKYLLFRAFAIGLCLGVLPVVIFSGWGEIFSFLIDTAITLSNSLISGMGIEPQIVQLTGLGAYLGSRLRVAEGVSIYLSFMALKFVWGLIPVIGRR